jgi:hypothetical protein
MKQHTMKSRLFLLGVCLGGSMLAAQAQTDSAKLYQKAEQLLIAMKMPEMYSNSINQSVEQQVAANPILANYRPEAKSLFEKWIGWPVVKKTIEKTCLKYFSAEDMDAITRFYQKPAGQKLALYGAGLMKDVLRVEQAALQPHVSEWNKFVSEKRVNQ